MGDQGRFNPRQFSGGLPEQPPRTVDDDAPPGMRQEFLEVCFGIAEAGGGPTAENLYRITSQTLGIAPSGNPYGGWRYATGRDLSRAGWTRVYDVVLRLGREFERAGTFDPYREGVNAVLAGYGSAWDLTADGRLERVLPEAAQELVAATVQELAAPELEAGRLPFTAARDAYDDRPRRDRDACTNAFDAMESVAKTKHAIPHATFGQVVAHVRQAQAQDPHIVTVLEGINTLRNRHFGHGMMTPFALTPAQVDFAYLTCVAGMLLFIRASE